MVMRGGCAEGRMASGQSVRQLVRRQRSVRGFPRHQQALTPLRAGV